MIFSAEKELSQYCGLESNPLGIDKSLRYSFNLWLKTEGITINKDYRNIEIIVALEYKDKNGYHQNNLYKKYIYFSPTWRHISMEIPCINEIQFAEDKVVSNEMKKNYTERIWVKLFMRGGKKGKIYFNNIYLIPKPVIEISQVEDILHNERWNLDVREDISHFLLFYERN